MNLIRSISGLEGLREKPRRLLSVFAHPDDEAYACIGALHRTASREDGAAVHLSLTRGEASTIYGGRGLGPEEVGDLREGRLVEVAGHAKLDGLIVMDLPDSRLAWSPLAEVGEKIGRVIDAFRPQIVIGPDPRGVNAHPDHVAAHWGLRAALATRPDVQLAMVAYTEEAAEAIRPRLLFPTPESEIHVVMELTPEETKAKEACLRIHEALVTLDPDGDPELLYRPAVERYSLLGENGADGAAPSSDFPWRAGLRPGR
jgi:LmbE family N-acetylglucosaminyl deacetylase